MKRRRKKFLERLMQPRRLFVIAFSALAILVIHYFVPDWRLQALGFFLVLVGEDLFLYFFMDDFSKDGIFTVQFYNLVIKLACNVLICIPIYFGQATSPFVASYNEKLPFLGTQLLFVFVTLFSYK
ncbi:hypothetical protein [Enterococcus malodoratus]|uniref:hypothetical protein n=1 Tax=Enterococcus malodoratus TaxID=71451 RepID=UPI0020731746|nr:hypothetical protein [Enterococcus malodoratus]